MKQDDIARLQQVLGRSAPQRPVETLFRHAKARFDEERSPKRERYGALKLVVKHGDKPLAGCGIVVTDLQGKPLEWSGFRKTTRNGIGVISMGLSRWQDNPVLHISVNAKQKEVVTITDLSPSQSRWTRHSAGSYVVETEWMTEYDDALGRAPEREIRRFNIAVASDAKNLEAPIAFVGRHGCFRLKHILVEGRRAKKIALRRKVPVSPIDNTLEAKMQNIDAILDFSESKYLRKLWSYQVRGDRRIPALIIPVNRFLGRTDQLADALRLINHPTIDTGA